MLGRVWALNPRAYSQLAPLGAKAGIPMLVVACALAAAGFGWFKHRRWAWWLALVIITTQVLGDFVNLFWENCLKELSVSWQQELLCSISREQTYGAVSELIAG
jgi:hypothetical protein